VDSCRQVLARVGFDGFNIPGMVSGRSGAGETPTEMTVYSVLRIVSR